MSNTAYILLFVFYGLPALAGLCAAFSLYCTMPGSSRKYAFAMLIPVVGAVVLYFYLPRLTYDVVKAVRTKQPLAERSRSIFEKVTG